MPDLPLGQAAGPSDLAVTTDGTLYLTGWDSATRDVWSFNGTGFTDLNANLTLSAYELDAGADGKLYFLGDDDLWSFDGAVFEQLT